MTCIFLALFGYIRRDGGCKRKPGVATTRTLELAPILGYHFIYHRDLMGGYNLALRVWNSIEPEMEENKSIELNLW